MRVLRCLLVVVVLGLSLSPELVFAQTATPTPTRTATPTRTVTPTPTQTPNVFAPGTRNPVGWYLCGQTYSSLGDNGPITCEALKWSVGSGFGFLTSEEWEQDLHRVCDGDACVTQITGSKVYIVPPSHTKTITYSCDIQVAMVGAGSAAKFESVDTAFIVDQSTGVSVDAGDGYHDLAVTPPSWENGASVTDRRFVADVNDRWFTQAIQNLPHLWARVGAFCGSYCSGDVDVACRVIGYSMFPTFAWTPAPSDYQFTPTPTPTNAVPTVTPTGTLTYSISTPLPMHTPQPIFMTPDASAGIGSGTPTAEVCRTLLPGFTLPANAADWAEVLGWDIGLSDWDPLIVCTQTQSYTLGFMGISFVSWATALLLAIGLGGVYNVFRSGAG